jgi:CRP/FNR family transcriptional activator FtrB
MRIAELQLIRALPLFKDVSDANFEALTEAAFLQLFPSHVVLIREGALPDFLHIVVDGNVELFAEHAGRETTIDIIGPMTTLILAAFIADEPYLKSARTLGESQILMIPARSVRDVLGRDAVFARAIVGELAARYRSIVRALKNEKLRGSAERLANWILKADAQQNGNGVVSFPVDKRTLASLLGMTPENLSRSLSSLARHGVRSSGRELVIEDRAALIEFAQPTPLIDG